jgi:hypothetical protein
VVVVNDEVRVGSELKAQTRSNWYVVEHAYSSGRRPHGMILRMGRRVTDNREQT